MPKLFLSAKIEEIDKGIEFIQNTLERYRIKGKAKMEAMLISEEAMVRLITKARENAEMQISVFRWYSTASITISVAGEAFSDNELQLDMSGAQLGHDSEEAIRSILLHAYADKMAYNRKGDYNFVKISVGAKERVFALRTVFAFTLAMAVALLASVFLSEAVFSSIAESVLLPIQRIFLNALELVTAPAVFFSIMTSIARFTSFSDPGRISIRIFVGYVLTSLFAVVLGVVLFRCFEPAIPTAGALNGLAASGTGGVGGSSVWEVIVNIVPNNIIAPFLNTNAIQLLVIALLGGVALGRAGRYSHMLSEVADALERFFSGAVSIVSNLIPTAVFFVTLLMVFQFGLESLSSAAIILGMVMLGLLVLFLLYLAMILIVGRLNPITFVRKYAGNMWSTFLLGSSIGAIPDTMRCCEKQFGISSGLYSFSIPFGAISNLDGNCVYLTIAGLFLAKFCGVDILGENLLTIAFMVIVLSVGSPITPGSAMLALTMLLSQMGISLSVISMVLGINALIEMLLAMCNTAGDVAITLVVARKEKLIDLSVYRQKE